MAQPGVPLSGTVTDATGAALVNVKITISDAATRTARTDAEGRFEFHELAAGNYELTAEVPGFAPLHKTVHLRPGESTNLALTLTVLVQEQTVVTASRTGEHDVQETPMAVTVLRGSELQRAEAHTVADLAGLAPSVTFSQNTGFAQLTIRGIGTNAVFAGSDPSSAVYIDGVYLARPASVLGDFLDLERVEVLRGPQGTLYGRNAVGGALNLITRQPTNDAEASARFVAGNFNLLRSEARVSGPIVRDRLFGSVAVLRGVREGSVRDLDHPDHPLGGEDVTGVQGKLRVLLPQRSELLVSADMTHQDPVPLVYAKVLAVKPGFTVDNPAALHDVRASTLAASRRLQSGTAARLTIPLATGTTLTSVTAYRKLDYDLTVDADITELDLAVSHVHEIHHQWSQEVTVAGQGPKLAWLGGLFLFGEHDRQPTVVTLGGPRLENHLDPDVEADTEAIFGQATLRVTPRLSATAGLRYSRERKSIDNAGYLSTISTPITIVPGTAYAYTDRMSNDAWTPKAAVEMRLTAQTITYLSATRGFKSGGFNLTSPEAGRGFAPEWAWSYEAGAKTAFAGGRAILNVAAFQTDYSDLQVATAIRPGVIDISNAAEATIRGVEVEGAVRLTQALKAGGHAAWLDAEYDRYIAVGAGGITGDVAGNRLSNAPGWSGRVWLEWSAALGRAGVASLRADSVSQSTVFFTPFNDAIQRQRPYGLLDLSAEFGPAHRRWSVAGFARNVTSEPYITGSFSSPPPAIGGRPGDPRQLGIQLTVRK